jgi:hypothetical protein
MEIGRIVRQQQAEQEVRIVRCGSCNAQNVVLDQNNHLHCWYAPLESRRWPFLEETQGSKEWDR